jgi:CRISPR type I-D-associated protein Csc2
MPVAVDIIPGLAPLQPYLVDSPRPLLTNKVLQLLFIREVLDYTVLRTEETRELNTVITPAGGTSAEQVERVAFLATKQKGAESREFGALLRTLNERDGRNARECYLKDQLCLECPRCVTFGATSTERGRNQQQANIKHRVAYSTAFSLAPVGLISEEVTFNGVSEATMLTGQTLNTRTVVKPATLFASIVTLQSVTWKEFVLVTKAILKSHRYGAETRIGGEVRNNLYGVIGGWEEVLTPLEFTLALGRSEGTPLTIETVEAIATEFAQMASMPDKVRVLAPSELDVLVSSLQGYPMPAEFVDAAYAEAKVYRTFQEQRRGQETRRGASGS